MAADDEMLVVEQQDERLEPFRELNKREKLQGKKVAWEERLEVVRKQYPSTEKLDWQKLFSQDSGLFGRLVNDILKMDAAEPGKPGKRPQLERHEAEERLRNLTNDRYTVLAFPDALRALSADRSIRHVANKTGLSRDMIWRLLAGSAQPTAYIMEVTARAFKKEPSYFYEYRIAYILGLLNAKFQAIPESTVAVYRRIQGALDE